MGIVESAAIVLTVLYLSHGVRAGDNRGGARHPGPDWLALRSRGQCPHRTDITDDISTAVGIQHSVNMQGLLLAGIVIGSLDVLGVLDDVTVTQAATVTELARASPAYGVGHLYRAGSRVGRCYIASVVNTILLAYAGSSLRLLILILANNDSLGGVVTDQIIAQEIVRSVVATLGLIAAVPVTTALVAVASRNAT